MKTEREEGEREGERAGERGRKRGERGEREGERERNRTGRKIPIAAVFPPPPPPPPVGDVVDPVAIVVAEPEVIAGADPVLVGAVVDPPS